MNGLKCLHLVADAIFEVVEDNGEGDSIEDALNFLRLIVGLQVYKETIFGGNGVMAPDMVDELL